MKRLIIQSVNYKYAPFIDLVYMHNSGYADKCRADYQIMTGLAIENMHPSWNRIPLILEALNQGYEKIVWLDADTLVVSPKVNIFTRTTNDVPLLMSRFDNILWQGEPHYNAGVMVINNSKAAKKCFEWVLKNRNNKKTHHYDTFWEQNFILDYVHKHRSTVSELNQRFNYIPGISPKNIEPVILGFHGGGLASIKEMKKYLRSLK